MLAWPFFTLNIKRHYTLIKYCMQIECRDEARNETRAQSPHSQYKKDYRIKKRPPVVG